MKETRQIAPRTPHESRGQIGALGFVDGDGELEWVRGEFCVYYETESHRI